MNVFMGDSSVNITLTIFFIWFFSPYYLDYVFYLWSFVCDHNCLTIRVGVTQAKWDLFISGWNLRKLKRVYKIGKWVVDIQPFSFIFDYIEIIICHRLQTLDRSRPGTAPDLKRNVPTHNLRLALFKSEDLLQRRHLNKKRYFF